ncbi:MAG: hypothetical protein ACREMQ_06505 [Longimicrobiales bacterium]
MPVFRVVPVTQRGVREVLDEPGQVILIEVWRQAEPWLDLGDGDPAIECPLYDGLTRLVKVLSDGFQRGHSSFPQSTRARSRMRDADGRGERVEIVSG